MTSSSATADLAALLGTATSTGDGRTRPDAPPAWDGAAVQVDERALVLPSRRRRRAATAASGPAAELLDRVRRPFQGTRLVAVVATKGGVGKTTTSLLLGHTFAALRQDRVVALDANPDAGTLGHRVVRTTGATATDLLDVVGQIRDYYELRRFTTQCPSRLEVVASADDPRDARAMVPGDVHDLLDRLREHFSLVIVDCGTGVRSAATQAVVEAADQVVAVTSPRVDAVHSLGYLLSWLAATGRHDLAARAVVAVNGVHPRGGVDAEALRRQVATAVRDVRSVPWDPDLAIGGVADLDALRPETRHALLELAAAVADGFTDMEAGR
jgi:MinD-like ATPase involved in chromosome partitioning or flagellar assembly